MNQNHFKGAPLHPTYWTIILFTWPTRTHPLPIDKESYSTKPYRCIRTWLIHSGRWPELYIYCIAQLLLSWCCRRHLTTQYAHLLVLSSLICWFLWYCSWCCPSERISWLFQSHAQFQHKKRPKPIRTLFQFGKSLFGGIPLPEDKWFGDHEVWNVGRCVWLV